MIKIGKILANFENDKMIRFDIEFFLKKYEIVDDYIKAIDHILILLGN